MMKAISFFLVSILILSFTSLAICKKSQQDPLRVKIQKKAEIMSNLLVEKNYEDFVKYLYPPFIDLFGGKAKLLEILKQGLPDGNSIKSVKISYPSETIKVNNQIQCTLKEEIEIKVKGGKIIAISTLIGISNDNGNTWYFLDANSKSLESLKKLYPNLSNKLIFVESSKPIYIRE